MQTNELGQQIGDPVVDWRPPPYPDDRELVGASARLERLRPEHADVVFAADQLDTDGRSWTYLPYGPFADPASYRSWVAEMAAAADPFFYAVVDRESEKAAGVLSLLRITPAAGSIEVGHIHLSPLLQRTRAATEAQYLLMRYAFDLGYRRYEWKCDALNEPSRQAAARLGFRFEGTFRQATVIKGRNRDTAWFAMTDQDWPAVREAFETWLADDNFDADGHQRTALRVPA